MGNIRTPELIIMLVVVLLLFGAKRLPEAARGLGRSLKIFKTEMQQQSSAADAAPVEGTVVTPDAEQTEEAPAEGVPAGASSAAAEPVADRPPAHQPS